jgi:hypothetical protein
LLGANTVNGPAALSASLKPALAIKPLRVLSDGVFAIVSVTVTGAETVAQPEIKAAKEIVAQATRLRRLRAKVIFDIEVTPVKSPERIKLL